MYTEEQNDGIYVEKQIRNPSFSMNYEHSHPYYEIFYLKTGKCIYSVNKSLYHITPGDVFIVAPGDLHCTHYEGTVPCERVIIYCELSCLPEFFFYLYPDLFENLKKSGKVILAKDGQEHLITILDRMISENAVPDKFSFHFMLLLLMESLLSIHRNGIFIYEQIKTKEKISSDIETALKFIALNYAQPITLEDVANEVNLIPTYLSKKFKDETGRTFKKYLNYIRIKQASQALLTTDDNITKIALDCGFSSSNYFKDLFRSLHGVSPRTYRNQSKSHAFTTDYYKRHGISNP